MPTQRGEPASQARDALIAGLVDMRAERLRFHSTPEAARPRVTRANDSRHCAAFSAYGRSRARTADLLLVRPAARNATNGSDPALRRGIGCPHDLSTSTRHHLRFARISADAGTGSA